MSRQALILGTGSHVKYFNTQKADGTPITLAGTPSLCARINGSDTEATAGLTLGVDSDSKTGLHKITLDVDNGTLALAANDEVDIQIAAGTVDSISVIGKEVWEVLIIAAGLTTAEEADVTTAVEAAGVNVEQVVGIPVGGAGTTGDPWGPA